VFIKFKEINGIKITKDNTLKDVLHSMYAPEKGGMPDSEYFNFYNEGAVSHAWEKTTDKNHDELIKEAFERNQTERYDKGLGRGKYTFTFDGYNVTVISS